MTRQEVKRMRELPALIQRTRSSTSKLMYARELRTLTSQYRRESQQLLEQRQEMNSGMLAASS